jgi:hypothetical protein
MWKIQTDNTLEQTQIHKMIEKSKASDLLVYSHPTSPLVRYWSKAIGFDFIGAIKYLA